MNRPADLAQRVSSYFTVVRESEFEWNSEGSPSLHDNTLGGPSLTDVGQIGSKSMSDSFLRLAQSWKAWIRIGGPPFERIILNGSDEKFSYPMWIAIDILFCQCRPLLADCQAACQRKSLHKSNSWNCSSKFFLCMVSHGNLSEDSSSLTISALDTYFSQCLPQLIHYSWACYILSALDGFSLVSASAAQSCLGIIFAIDASQSLTFCCS